MIAPSSDRLFGALDATWPPVRFLDDGPWRLREGRGGGQRVSSATATRKVAGTDIPRAENGMRLLGQRPLFMIRQRDSALDQWLDRLGYDIVDPVTMYLAPTEMLASEPAPSTVIAAWPPLAIQREIWAAGGVGQDRIAVMERAASPRTAILGRHGDTPGGTGFLAVDRDVAMLHALEVVPVLRRKGIGRLILSAAAHWAQRQGAQWMALAVTAANTPANALYQHRGMAPAGHYHYRRAAEVST